MTSATSATSEGAQGIFSKITFLKSVRSNEKDEVCHSFLVEIFTKSLHRGGVTNHFSGVSDKQASMLKFPSFFSRSERLDIFSDILSELHKLVKRKMHIFIYFSIFERGGQSAV